jgi:hypothetical protein
MSETRRVRSVTPAVTRFPSATRPRFSFTDITRNLNNFVVNNALINMDDEDITMEDAPVKWPSAKGKGKAKAVEETDAAAEAENLPWWVAKTSLRSCSVSSSPG